jgi:molybdate transport system ATP-binding protein
VPAEISPPLRCQIRVHHRGEQGHAFELDVDLELKPGITILFGPSGSGKSTTLQAIAGLCRPNAGRIALGDEVWFDAAKRIDRPIHLRHVAYVFQSLALFPHMTGLGNVAYGIDRRVPGDQRAERALALLERLGVAHLAHSRPNRFSGGEAQRVALARALAMKPRVILLDEPFSALDRDLRVQLARLVRSIVDELRIPLVQVTHNHGEARALGDHIVRLDKGKVLSTGSYDQVLGEADDRTPMPDLTMGSRSTPTGSRNQS